MSRSYAGSSTTRCSHRTAGATRSTVPRALMNVPTSTDGSLRRWLRKTPVLALVASALALIAEGCSKPGLPAVEGALPQILEVKRSSVHLNAVSFSDRGWIAAGDFGVIAVSGDGV